MVKGKMGQKDRGETDLVDQMEFEENDRRIQNKKISKGWFSKGTITGYKEAGELQGKV